MQTKVLIAYTTNAGSTSQVAEAVAGELGKDGAAVEVRRLEEIEDLSPYTAVVVGGPMILGWHRGVVKFLKKHQQALSRVPVAYFFTAKSLTSPREKRLNGVPLQIDPYLAQEPKDPTRLSLRERYATVENYLGPALKKLPQIKPVSAAFFAGKVDFTRLKLPQMLFVMLVIGAQPGDRRNWDAVRDWAGGLRSTLLQAGAGSGQDPFDVFEGHRYTALSTYRKTGAPVVTPVWFVKQDGRLFVWTAKDSGKAKRLRNNPCVQLAPSNHSGKPLGSVREGLARFVPESEHPALKEVFRTKYGWQVSLFTLLWKIQGHQHTYIEISPPGSARQP